MALELPASGTAPTLMQPESRVALLTCLRRRMEAHIAVGDKPRLHAWSVLLGQLLDGRAPAERP